MKITEVINELIEARSKLGECDVLADFWKIDKVRPIKEYDNGDEVRPIVNLE